MESKKDQTLRFLKEVGEAIESGDTMAAMMALAKAQFNVKADWPVNDQ